jgi:hypothetical protein
MQQCHGLTKAGNPCKRRQSLKYCFAHRKRKKTKTGLFVLEGGQKWKERAKDVGVVAGSAASVAKVVGAFHDHIWPHIAPLVGDVTTRLARTIFGASKHPNLDMVGLKRAKQLLATDGSSTEGTTGDPDVYGATDLSEAELLLAQRYHDLLERVAEQITASVNREAFEKYSDEALRGISFQKDKWIQMLRYRALAEGFDRDAAVNREKYFREFGRFAPASTRPEDW